ncbi:MAG: energy transducer TonB [Maricaulaceae bacterium]
MSLTQKTITSTCLMLTAFVLTSCASSDPQFQARSQYPPDPWVKGHASPDDCIGGEELAARHIPLPEYPKKALRRGNQGWVIVKLDVGPDGTVDNVIAEKSIPSNVFENHTLRTLKTWTFAPPRQNSLQNCRVLIRYRLGVVSLA